MAYFLLIALVSYLLGSIPFGYLLVRIVRREDVRLSGSGNIGATNVSRKSPALGLLTLLLDAAKGAVAVEFAARISAMHGTGRAAAMSLAALVSVLGHMFPVWLKFRGGKGVATGLGSFAMIAPKPVLMAAALFVLILAVTRYVSLGSIIAVAAFPLMAWIVHEYDGNWAALALMAATSAMIVWRHRENIRRLLSGRENRLGGRQRPASAPKPEHQ